MARDPRHASVLIAGMGQHNPACDVHQATHLAGPTGAKEAGGEAAFRMAGLTLDDVDACEIYDCFTYTVELDEGPHLLTNVVGCDPDRVTCGMPVEGVWDDVTVEFSLPRSRPAGGK